MTRILDPGPTNDYPIDSIRGRGEESSPSVSFEIFLKICSFVVSLKYDERDDVRKLVK